MPIYEYRCQACGAELEKLQKISEPPLSECPECGRETLVKLVSASSFRLKGGGWYESDFKTGKKKNGVGDESSGGANSGEKSGEKSGDKSSESSKSGSSKTEAGAGAKQEKPAAKGGGNTATVSGS